MLLKKVVKNTLMTVLTVALVCPMLLWADTDLGDIDSGSEDVHVEEDQHVDNNNGDVSSNEGSIDNNNGNVDSNTGSIDTNSQSGTVDSNGESAPVIPSGEPTSDPYTGSITTNLGDVNTNATTGIINQNGQTDTSGISEATPYIGNVDVNNGTVLLNEATGLVGQNVGYVGTPATDNAAAAGSNNGTITTNGISVDPATGTPIVTLPDGTTQPYVGIVPINNGTVVTNEITGQIITNNGNVGTITMPAPGSESTDPIVNGGNNGTIVWNNPGASVAVNNGLVETNKAANESKDAGSIATNNGSVTTNEGTVDKNFGDVNKNLGTITDNAKTHDKTGTVNTNGQTAEAIPEGENPEYVGKIVNNSGDVLINEKTGFIKNNSGNIGKTTNSTDTDGNTTTVSEGGNKGTVETNNADGNITENSGIVGKNYGDINTNTGKVGENDGNVDINESTGIIETNNGQVIIAHSDEGGIEPIITDPTTGVWINSGQIEKNFGYVNYNDGIIDVNSPVAEGDPVGHVRVNTGTITLNNGAVSVNSGVVATNDGEIVDNFGTVEAGEGTIYNNYGDAAVNEGQTVQKQWWEVWANAESDESGNKVTNWLKATIGGITKKIVGQDDNGADVTVDYVERKGTLTITPAEGFSVIGVTATVGTGENAVSYEAKYDEENNCWTITGLDPDDETKGFDGNLSLVYQTVESLADKMPEGFTKADENTNPSYQVTNGGIRGLDGKDSLNKDGVIEGGTMICVGDKDTQCTVMAEDPEHRGQYIKIDPTIYGFYDAKTNVWSNNADVSLPTVSGYQWKYDGIDKDGNLQFSLASTKPAVPPKKDDKNNNIKKEDKLIKPNYGTVKDEDKDDHKSSSDDNSSSSTPAPAVYQPSYAPVSRGVTNSGLAFTIPAVSPAKKVIRQTSAMNTVQKTVAMASIPYGTLMVSAGQNSESVEISSASDLQMQDQQRVVSAQLGEGYKVEHCFAFSRPSSSLGNVSWENGEQEIMLKVPDLKAGTLIYIMFTNSKGQVQLIPYTIEQDNMIIQKLKGIGNGGLLSIILGSQVKVAA